MKRVITYGTFDTFHFGHLELLSRARDLGDYLVVGLSTDSFNTIKGKQSLFDFKKRKEWLNSIKYVDKIIPEKNWEQKTNDIIKNKINILVMGEDWRGKFDHFFELCDVVYLPRTEGISSSLIKSLN